MRAVTRRRNTIGGWLSVDADELAKRSAIAAHPCGRRDEPSAGGEVSMKVAAASTSRAAEFARMARAGDRLFFTWTEVAAGPKRVHVARASF